MLNRYMYIMNISLMCLEIAFCLIFKYRIGINVKEGNTTICYLVSLNVDTLKNRKLTNSILPS